MGYFDRNESICFSVILIVIKHFLKQVLVLVLFSEAVVLLTF